LASRQGDGQEGEINIRLSKRVNCLIDIINKELCTGCFACANICPRYCISMKIDSEGFWYPFVDKDKCIDCGLCEKTCPIINIREPRKYNGQKAYACYNKDESIRLESSSGGLFTVFAEAVIDDGGIVFGAAFNEQFNVDHSYVKCKDKLSKFRGSKYIQSKIGETYKQAENFLKQGRKVLFTGTPCQIGGLKSYLRREYDNLLCQDIICFGVPSPMVWQKYLSFRKKKSGVNLQAVSFRGKEEGWRNYSLSLLYEDSVEYCNTYNRDMYLVAFNKNLYLRPSCASCAFRKEQRDVDITLADFWGIQNVAPEMDDDKGTSLLVIHSEKGQMFFDEIKDKVISLQVEIKEAIKYNPAMIKSVAIHPYREKFFAELNRNEFDVLIKKYCKDKLSLRAKRKAKLVARKALIRLGLFEKFKKGMGRG
jgi:coenzyme F420-reducing hydrogenase beta subunit